MAPRLTPLLLTSELPGTGGVLKTAPEDFLVEELPAYLPSGTGPHTYLWIEKRGLTTEEALVRLCRATGVARDGAGAAGMKDRQAITRQWISLPDVEPAVALAATTPELQVLRAERHGNKLKTGHLRGNRFTIRLRGLRCAQSEAVVRAQAILDRLGALGLPNRYGAQRFGARGDNAEQGRALLRGGDPRNDSRSGGRRDYRRFGRSERRLMVSALQSELFNAYLDGRMRDGALRTVVAGDLLRKRESGGIFAAAEEYLPAVQARLDAGEIDITGPMFGHKMQAPTAGSLSAAREQAVLEQAGMSLEDFAAAGALAEGTRRPLTVPVEDARVELANSPDSIMLWFSLPSGAYATVLVDEIAKPQ